MGGFHGGGGAALTRDIPPRAGRRARGKSFAERARLRESGAIIPQREVATCLRYVARVHHFHRGYRTDLFGFNSNHIQRLPVERKELDLIGLTCTVDMHHRADVPRFKPVFGKISCQDNTLVFFDHLYHLFTG